MFVPCLNPTGWALHLELETSQHTCIHSVSGEVYCWGKNTLGQLGVGDNVNRSLPTYVINLYGYEISSLGASEMHTCAVTADHSLACWGWNVLGQLGLRDRFGRNSPAVVQGFPFNTILAAGWAHTCFGMSDNTLACWGRNDVGQLGLGDLTNRTSPTPVPDSFSFVEVTAGFSHTCGLRRDSKVECWGSNVGGALGTGDTTLRVSPTEVPGLSDVASLSAGYIHTCARKTDGTVVCWGSNGTGQVGVGDDVNRLVPTVVPGLANVVEISAGGYHTCALMVDGGVACWGYNFYGQLGVGDNITRLSPVLVPGLVWPVVAISAGEQHTCALRYNATIQCWGNGEFGQLGLNSPLNFSSPRWVQSLWEVAKPTLGSFHTCGRGIDRAVSCWGNNEFGQLGLGDTSNRFGPNQVSGVDEVAALAGGGQHTCARRTDGALRCWGRNAEGQLGIGSNATRLTPTEVPGLPGNIDVISPSIQITNPTSAQNYITASGSINVGGVASDNVAVVEITWENDRGGSGSALGTTTWLVSDIILGEGSNVVTVTARDSAENTTSDVLVVSYEAPDTAPPTIEVLSPVAGSSVTIGTGFVQVGGSASDNVGLSHVTWANNRGGGGSANGTNSWIVPSIALQRGVNDVEFVAHDLAGNLSSDWLAVSHSPSHEIFVSGFETPELMVDFISPSIVTIGTPFLLSWNAVGATHCVPSGGNSTDWAGLGLLPVDGSQLVASPASQGIGVEFTITCVDGNSSVSDSEFVSFLFPENTPPFISEIDDQVIVQGLVSSFKCNAQPVGFRHGTNIQAPVSRGARLDHG
jgi:alpha-tubulin suppressor-like RCC1 family protein